jgi:hypothetical protein
MLGEKYFKHARKAKIIESYRTRITYLISNYSYTAFEEINISSPVKLK